MMILATSEAASKDIGLGITFILLLGIVVGIVVVYMVIQLRGEHIQNREYIASHSRESSPEP
jgi:hypothetical protein